MKDDDEEYVRLTPEQWALAKPLFMRREPDETPPNAEKPPSQDI